MIDPQKTPPAGTRARLAVDANLQTIVGQSVPLLTLRNLHWGPWAVTLDPITFNAAGPGLYSWQTAGIDHSEYVGYPVNGRPLVVLSFGAAGVLRTVCFDYPTAGAAFCVNGNAVELSVQCRTQTAPYADANHVPQVGAWLTPAASPASPTAMTLFAGSEMVGGTYTVPPFARSLLVSAYVLAGTAVPADEMQVTWYFDALVASVRETYRVGAGSTGNTFRVPVPNGAVAVAVEQVTAGAYQASGVWELSFA